jgi:2,4-dienoyl-CoA reductase-like NADH-dependent reductase (Old Yellow Enzyme family)
MEPDWEYSFSMEEGLPPRSCQAAMNRFRPRGSSCPGRAGLTRELTVPEIEQIVQRFAEAAKRAKAAGIDGVEIHAGHGYLINRSCPDPITNAWMNMEGACLDRARFLLEIIREVRKAVGVQYPLWCRLDGQEFSIVDGITREEPWRQRT